VKHPVSQEKQQEVLFTYFKKNLGLSSLPAFILAQHCFRDADTALSSIILQLMCKSIVMLGLGCETQQLYYVRIYCPAFQRAKNRNRCGLTDLRADSIANESGSAQMVKKRRNMTAWPNIPEFKCEEDVRDLRSV